MLLADGALYPGEEIRMTGNYPALVRFFPAPAKVPLVVFITGGGVLARIAYGHPAARPSDFIAHWLQKAGDPFMAISYPLDNPVFQSVHPEFSVKDWAGQTAESVADIVRGNGLPDRVVVLGWSMAGRVAGQLNVALKRRGIAVELFVAMSAATVMPNVLPGLRLIRPSAKGLGSIGDGFADWLVACLRDQNDRAGHGILDEDVFRNAYLGDFPINLAASALRYRDGAFVEDAEEDYADTGAWQYADLPPLALITHRSAIDARHAILDRSAWSFFLTQSICERAVWPEARQLTSMPDGKWRELLDLIEGAADRLTATVEGNHMFLVGEPSARATIEAVSGLRDAAQAMSQTLQRLGPGILAPGG